MPYYTGKYSPHNVPAFYDVTGITESPEAFQSVIDILVQRYKLQGAHGPTHIAGFDARGFIFGPPLALALGLPFVLIRKAGKLPGVLASAKYETEYSEDETVMRVGSVSKGNRVVLVDDLIATGGTALSGFDLVDALGASVHEFTAIIDLPHLEGVRRIHSYRDGYYKVRILWVQQCIQSASISLSPPFLCLCSVLYCFQDVPCFTVLDSTTIGPDMCKDPPDGTPRVVSALDAESTAAKLRSRSQ